MFYKTKIYLMVMPCFFFTCKMPGDIDNNGSIIGKYKNIEFIVSGPGDGAFDITPYGAYVQLELKKERKAAGHVFIPDTTALYFLGTKGTTRYEGTFSIRNDSLFLGESQIPHILYSPIMQSEFKWKRSENQLINEWKGRGYQKLVLQKE